ncbi:MAG: YraN family protein [Coriobacteriales bacterium]|jgi:putative endonuclease|nr:YraN family protein [Coriobacteriales bacterium]
MTVSAETKSSTLANSSSPVRSKASTRSKASANSIQSKDAGTGEKSAQTAGQSLGKVGEQLSSTYLEQNGFEILERNWRCKAGEADIIAFEDDTLVFIEVKTRSQSNCGLPEDAVTAQKRTRYENIAINYLMHHQLPTSKVRFDVISLLVFSEHKAFLRHHRDAFFSDE